MGTPVKVLLYTDKGAKEFNAEAFGTSTSGECTTIIPVGSFLEYFAVSGFVVKDNAGKIISKQHFSIKTTVVRPEMQMTLKVYLKKGEEIL